MTNEEVVARLKAEAGKGCPRGARKRVADETGLDSFYLYKIVTDRIKGPGPQPLDILRKRYESQA